VPLRPCRLLKQTGASIASGSQRRFNAFRFSGIAAGGKRKR
jgi:hypothetical protein